MKESEGVTEDMKQHDQMAWVGAMNITTQRVVIHYTCIGAFDVPDRRKIPEADILLQTRKGVALGYAPGHIAV